MAKSKRNASSGNRGSKGGNRVTSRGKGRGGLPSKTGNPSGKGRDNAPSKKGK